MDTNVLLPVIEILKNDGASEDYIADVLADITTAATVLMYSKAMDVLSDENLKDIEDCPSDEEANKLIMHVYAGKTGTSPQEVMNLFLKEYATTFIREHIIKKDAEE